MTTISSSKNTKKTQIIPALSFISVMRSRHLLLYSPFFLLLFRDARFITISGLQVTGFDGHLQLRPFIVSFEGLGFRFRTKTPVYAFSLFFWYEMTVRVSQLQGSVLEKQL